MELSAKRKAFCDAYLANGMNATKAAKEAGYSDRTAYSQGNRLLKNAEVREYIKERTEELARDRIVSGNEVLAFLSDVMSGNMLETKIVVTDGEVVEHGYVDQRNQLKAAEVLAKCHGLMVQKVNHNGAVAVTFVDDLPEDDDVGG